MLKIEKQRIKKTYYKAKDYTTETCPNCGAVGTIKPDGKGASYYCRNKIMRKGDLTPSLCGWTMNKNCLGNKQIPAELKKCRVCGTKEDLRTEKKPNGTVYKHNICKTCHGEYMSKKYQEKKKEYYARRLKNNPNYVKQQTELRKIRYQQSKKAA